MALPVRPAVASVPSEHKDISIVFFGSGPVAAESLKLLVRDFTVEAVITKPRPTHHKGEFPVIDWCRQAGSGITVVHTVGNKRELSELFSREQFRSRVGIVIDFGIIIAQDVIDIFPLGILNSHFSLLPEWRGADPISFSILSGQKQTGVSLMRITAGLDEGPILALSVYEMAGAETTPSLTAYLIQLSHALLQTELPRYISGNTKLISQTKAATFLQRSAKPSYSRKLTKADGIIDWTKPAEQIEHEIRAYAEWPRSRTILGDKDVIIIKAHSFPSQEPGAQPGSVEVIADIGAIIVTTGNGSLCIDELQPAGKRPMTAKEFLAGNQL